MALGAVDDEALTERVGAAIGREARALGVNVVYAPSVDLASKPATRRGHPLVRQRPRRGRPSWGGDGPRPPVGRGGRHGEALPGSRRARPGHSSRPRCRGREPRPSGRPRVRPVPGGYRGRGQADDVGPRRGAGTDRRPDPPRDAVTDRDGRHAARPIRFRRVDDQRRARHAGACPGRGTGGRDHRGDPCRDRPAPVRAGPAGPAPDRGDTQRGSGPWLVRTGRTRGLERAAGRPSILARGRRATARPRRRWLGRSPGHLARARRAGADQARRLERLAPPSRRRSPSRPAPGSSRSCPSRPT